MSKKPKSYESAYKNKKYTDGMIHIKMDTKEDNQMRDFTIQDQTEHVLRGKRD